MFLVKQRKKLAPLVRAFFVWAGLFFACFPPMLLSAWLTVGVFLLVGLALRQRGERPGANVYLVLGAVLGGLVAFAALTGALPSAPAH